MIPAPMYFGVGEKFEEWRANQAEACQSILEGEDRFLIQVCPTGFGKSVTYMTAAVLCEGRAVILTSTKGLQTQLMNDFGHMDDVVEMRGRGNYPCRLNTKVNCDSGLCVYGVPCSMRDQGGCFYFDALREAKRAKIVVTNYAYWMAQNEFADGIGEFALLIADEGHSAIDHVISHVSVEFSRKSKWEKETLGLGGVLPSTLGEWREWADDKLNVAKEELEQAKEKRQDKRYHVFKRMVGKLERITDHMNREWVWESDAFKVTLSPIWPKKLTESTLFTGIPRIVVTSATVVPKTAELLGIAGDDMEYEEYPHSFPVERRPLIHTPSVRMNWRNGPMEERMWLSKVDAIIRDRIGKKGIIHTVSYARRDLVLQRSAFRDHMITHESKTAEQVVRSFKRAKAPCILVSPSMVTGWDFPHDECRWQIIVKLPFPDTRGEIMKARSKADRDFTNYVTMQQLIQTTGRGTRAANDWCETFVTDNSIQWFIKQNTHLMVEWFNGAYRLERMIPKPLDL